MNDFTSFLIKMLSLESGFLGAIKQARWYVLGASPSRYDHSISHRSKSPTAGFNGLLDAGSAKRNTTQTNIVLESTSFTPVDERSMLPVR